VHFASRGFVHKTASGFLAMGHGLSREAGEAAQGGWPAVKARLRDQGLMFIGDRVDEAPEV
jgi:hypothetical protein